MGLEDRIKGKIQELLKRKNSLGDVSREPEKKTEEYLRPLFEELGWDWLSREVRPQSPVRTGARTTRVDYSFRKTGELRPAFYVEVKRFSDDLEGPDKAKQVLDYGKNGGIRWVVITNFDRWRVFNSDFFDEPQYAELFEFNLEDCLKNNECLNWLLFFARAGETNALDKYAKTHKKWKESADVEELLTRRLSDARSTLSKAIWTQNMPKFDTGQDAEKEIDACVQHILDRIIFCRMLEDNGGDPDRKLIDVLEKWKSGDKRIQFYKDYLCPFFQKMHDKYDSTIFDADRIDRLSIKNEDFVPVLESFYSDPGTRLRYRFDAINVDILGHAYENYLAWNPVKKRTRSEDEKKFKRKQSGVYYTPEFLVDFLVRNTLGEKLKQCKTPEQALKMRVLDPACGSGTFLVRAFEEFKQWFLSRQRAKGETTAQTTLDSEGENGISGFLDAVLEHCIYGIDVDPRAVRLARLNLFIRAADTPKQLPQLNVIERNSLVWDQELLTNIQDGTAFVFERDFPSVRESGGFDVVLGNPPWEKWKPDSQEFFEVEDPGFKSLPTQQAKARMEELLRTRRGLRMKWNNTIERYAAVSEFYRDNYEWQSGETDGKKKSGDLDLYKIFTERFYQLLKPGGLAGIVIPSGIYTDLGAKGLRTMLFDKTKLTALYSFENRGHALFPDVHASYKPILLCFEKGGKTAKFPCAFFLHTAYDLKRAEQEPTVMSVEFVRKASLISWGVLEIKSRKDYAIVSKLLKHPSLGESIDGKWNVDIARGFDMTNDSHLFRESLAGIPLLEGKNIEQFTHQWKEAPIPRYKVLEKDAEDNLKPEKRYYEGYWMAYRLIASSTNYRTLISTIIPPGYVCGNSLAIIRLPSLKELCYLSGVMNSFVVDYFIRQKVSANVNMFYFLETPVPRLASGPEFDAIARKTAQLVATTDEFGRLEKELGIRGIKSENERNLARAQLDVMVAKLYGVTKEELQYILTKFPNVDEKQKELTLTQY
jgi:Alw26I/Eco31I/Esp3I family type II restriction m6 adenine DNA methyltransferase